MNGLTLLAPAGLFALAALAVPLLIHLFSRSRGKRVLVGNIALYRQAQRQRVTQLKLVQWLLLLLRLLLLALAALLLAGLARKGLETLPGNTAYVTPSWLTNTADPAEVLAPFDNAFVLGPDTDSVTNLKSTGPGDPWTQLAERLASTRHAGEVDVFALGADGQFPDQPPALGDAVQWHLEPGPADPAPVAVLTILLVHAPGREADATELRVALEALAAHREVPLMIERGTTEQPPRLPERDDHRRIMIWLGDQPAPRSLIDAWGAGTWLEDRRPSLDSLFNESRLPRFPQLEFSARPDVERNALPDDVTILWWTRDGRPLLRQTERGQTRHLVFEDRFGQGGLTAQAAFPEALLRLMLGEAEWQASLAHAPADPTEVFSRQRADDDGPSRPLGPWLALAIALTFMLERWLSERRPRRSPESGAP